MGGWLEIIAIAMQACGRRTLLLVGVLACAALLPLPPVAAYAKHNAAAIKRTFLEATPNISDLPDWIKWRQPYQTVYGWDTSDIEVSRSWQGAVQVRYFFVPLNRKKGYWRADEDSFYVKTHLLYRSGPETEASKKAS